LIIELIEREFERIKAELAQVLEQAQGYDFLFYTAGPEVATPPMLSPSTFAELVTPYERALVQMIHDAGHLSAIHCHGRIRLVLDQFLQIGIDALEPVEPPPQGDITLQEALAHVDGRMCLMGYIQDQDLYTAQPGEMREKVRAIRQLVQGRTGYIMTSTATPYMDPPPPQFVRNYVEYIKAAAE
jgi:uroporphyrinogen-III decarboxylase